MRPRRRLTALAAGAAALALAGCASGPLSKEGVRADLTPEEAVSNIDAARDSTVLWGGIIANARNLPERTRLEVVSYPLDSHSQRPRTGAPPGTRFLAFKTGYLETAEFRSGRRITVRGTVSGTEEGRIGEAAYTYPTVRVESLELWPEQEAGRRSEPRFNFGFGIILSN